MGLDWETIPSLKNAVVARRVPLIEEGRDDPSAVSTDPRFGERITAVRVEDTFRFRPRTGWDRRIEPANF